MRGLPPEFSNIVGTACYQDLKQIAAILFLSVFLFNLAGYQLVIYFLQGRHQSALASRLDREAYRNEDLVSIKTPLTLPYYTNSATYERVDGAIEVDGITYHYVKRRIYNDSLELLCLPSAVKQRLQSAGVDYFKRSNDGHSGKEDGSATRYLKNVLPEFCDHLITYTLPPAAPCTRVYAVANPSPFTAPPADRQDHPPETMPG